jgi:hypothetical protein
MNKDRELLLRGEFGFVTGTVGNEVGLAVFIVVIGSTVAIRFGHRQQQTVVGIVEMQDKAVRTGNTLTESYFIWI